MTKDTATEMQTSFKLLQYVKQNNLEMGQRTSQNGKFPGCGEKNETILERKMKWILKKEEWTVSNSQVKNFDQS